MIEILQKDDPVLRQKSAEVSIEEIGSKKIQKIIKDMQKALESQEDGVAIAAPQIGQSLRIFVMSKKVFDIIGSKPRRKPEVPENSPDSILPFEDSIFINPKIIKLSREKGESEEGCLSVRHLYGKIMRSKKATIEAYDENGKKFVSGGSGIIAQIFQHECDHLDGVLFVDKAKRLEEIIPESGKNKNKIK